MHLRDPWLVAGDRKQALRASGARMLTGQDLTDTGGSTEDVSARAGAGAGTDSAPAAMSRMADAKVAAEALAPKLEAADAIGVTCIAL